MNRISVPSPFRKVADVVCGLRRLEEALVASADRRGVFVTAYLQITQTLQQWRERRRFFDNSLIGRYIVAFAELYRGALANYESGERSKVPHPWILSFEASRAGSCSIAQDLLLGINAHINHDLAFAILLARLNPNCELCYRDHLRINFALREATPIIRRKIVYRYKAGHRIANYILGGFLDKVAANAFRETRRTAWTAAQVLELADSQFDKEIISKRIEARATSAAQMILDCKEGPARCMEILQLVERLSPLPIGSLATAALCRQEMT